MQKKKNNTNPSSKSKTQLSDETLPYFVWEWRSYTGCAQSLLNAYPMERARTEKVWLSRLMALDCILSNQKIGKELIVRNFSRINADELGFARGIFLDLLNHLEKVALIGREGAGFSRSIITYSTRIRRYLPHKFIYQPQYPVMIRDKKEKGPMVKVNTADRRNLKERMERIWAFYREHEINPGLDEETFELFNEHQIIVQKKEPLVPPDPAMILPYIVFNDRDLRKGGRMYGAFWISQKKILRRAITIDGELTADLDGKGMHVQLLYRFKGLSMPSGDPYIFNGNRRGIAKMLMLLMMNTKEVYHPERGRQAVKKTYQHHHGKVDGLADLILELEAHHHQILDLLYRPNWGDLQRTEAAIMLRIMEAGMAEGIVVLPVHDGCLCPRQYAEIVLGFFESEGIIAEENMKHHRPLPVDETRDSLRSFRRLAQVA